jgi:hypothetical protein
MNALRAPQPIRTSMKMLMPQSSVREDTLRTTGARVGGRPAELAKDLGAAAQGCWPRRPHGLAREGGADPGFSERAARRDDGDARANSIGPASSASPYLSRVLLPTTSCA